MSNVKATVVDTVLDGGIVREPGDSITLSEEQFEALEATGHVKASKGRRSAAAAASDEPVENDASTEAESEGADEDAPAEEPAPKPKPKAKPRRGRSAAKS